MYPRTWRRGEAGRASPGTHFRCFSILSEALLPSEGPWASVPELRYILSTCFSASFRQFCREVMAAQMAGLPKPCVMRLKWVRQPWIPGSRMGAGLEFPSGERSWVRRSVNSLQICLTGKQSQQKGTCVTLTPETFNTRDLFQRYPKILPPK